MPLPARNCSREGDETRRERPPAADLRGAGRSPTVSSPLPLETGRGLPTSVLPRRDGDPDSASFGPTEASPPAQILECAPLSVRASKQAAMQGLDATSLEAAQAMRFEQLQLMVRSQDFIEGPLAFSQKRPPQWKGR